MSETPRFTNFEQKFLDVLSDGEPHLRQEFEAIVKPSGVSAVHKHLVSIRKKIRPLGQDVVCVVMQRRIGYRQIRVLADANSGRT